MMVREMEERMPASEFFEWMMLEQIDPFGERRADIHAGLLSTLIANIYRAKNRRKYKLADFLLSFDEPKTAKRQTPEEMHARFLQVTKRQRELGRRGQ
jgi:hypothetical protein